MSIINMPCTKPRPTTVLPLDGSPVSSRYEVIVNDRIVKNEWEGKLGASSSNRRLGATQQRSDGSIRNYLVGITEVAFSAFLVLHCT